ncbi:Putative zinc-finger [Modestobacter sp. DSM 44400]|uniref:anti-sigma factor family protein n=1 Tax=Modestobacter sp. DSM 44400 TaxID=1550230 RepID=UPI00089899B7|nr:zf-HC2 domain-containing protein [Modestobacter sp. DSM 44400]SDX83716.1 Putative zinc-finger [Modestobacter sp. DSM 44400]
MTGPDRFEHYDAAYVLGALSREDRIAFETHLPTCPRCSAAVAELAVLPGLLARLPGLPAPADTPQQLPETVLPGILATVRRARSRRRVWGAAAGVTAAAVLVTGTAVVTDQIRPDSATSPAVVGESVPLTVVGDAPVDAELRLEGAAWGTRITMTCRYDGPAATGPYDTGITYHLVVVSQDDSIQSVASWQVLPGRDARVAGSTDLTSDEIAEVQLRDDAGTVLLEGAPSR